MIFVGAGLAVDGDSSWIIVVAVCAATEPMGPRAPPAASSNPLTAASSFINVFRAKEPPILTPRPAPRCPPGVLIGPLYGRGCRAARAQSLVRITRPQFDPRRVATADATISGRYYAWPIRIGRRGIYRAPRRAIRSVQGGRIPCGVS